MRNLENVMNKCIAQLEALGIEPGEIVSIVPNYRAKSRWGQCKYRPDGKHEININAILLDETKSSDDGLASTVMHEIIHTCKGCCNHGAEFKRIARLVNRTYGYNVKTASTAEDKGISSETNIERKEYKFLITCNKCGCEFHRQKESNVTKHPENYKCHCGGKLTVTRL